MKVLIIHASFGAGHRRAAQATAEAFRKNQIEPEVRDLLEFMPPSMSRFYSFAYDFMITRSRGLWRLTYELVNKPKTPYSPAIGFTQKWQFKKLKKFLVDGEFTHIVSTHFTPSALLADWRSRNGLNSRIFSIVTDHVAHRCWKRTGLDHYFVASERVEQEMRDCGVPESDLTVSGIPISDTFCHVENKETTRKELNLSKEQKVVLVLCSALTVKLSIAMLREFARVQGSDQFLVSTGHDSKKEQLLKKEFGKDKRFTIFGFSTQIAQMMRASDVVVTKPGGLSVSEALAVGLPQILLEPIPGQEEANARFSEKAGAAVRIRHQKGLFFETLSSLLGDENKLAAMSEAARKAGRPMAAQDVVRKILASWQVI